MEAQKNGQAPKADETKTEETAEAKAEEKSEAPKAEEQPEEKA